MVLGTTLIGGLVTAHYRADLQLPAFLSDVQTMLASETLAGAHHVATGLAGDQAQQLMQQAGSAFAGGIALALARFRPGARSDSDRLAYVAAAKKSTGRKPLIKC
ncbi:hypothetical protein [Pseudomonas sp. B26(2017)]|uniref:hypothetical protein n=1 Tax=Pseudomonas sp. B26(2017) TaxID=1981732 RepID=UPI0021155EB6|nr:hypothetical protein [Pseudomonas sp. B26(2017)]